MTTEARTAHRLRVIRGGAVGPRGARQMREAHRIEAELDAMRDELAAARDDLDRQILARVRMEALAQRHGAAGHEIEAARDGGTR